MFCLVFVLLSGQEREEGRGGWEKEGRRRGGGPRQQE